MTVLQSSINQGETRRDRAANTIAWITAVLATLALPIHLYFALQTGAWQLFDFVSSATTLAVAAWICLIFVRRGQTELGINIFLWIGQLAFLAGSALLAGTGLIFGLSIMLGVTIITAETIRPERSQLLLLGGVFFGVMAFLLDAFDPNFRLAAPATLQWIFIGLSGSILLIYIYFFIRHFYSYSLQIKLITTAIGLISMPLMVLGYIQTNDIRARTITETGAEFTTFADQVALSLDTFFNDNLTGIGIDAQQPDFPNYLSDLRAGNLTGDLQDETFQALRILTKKDPGFISSYAVLDANGIDVIDSNGALIGRNESQQAYFTTAMSSNQPYVSPLLYQADSKSMAFYFSAPIHDASGTPIGVLRVKYAGDAIQHIVADYTKSTRTDAYAAVLDENQIFVAHGLDPQLILKSANLLPAPTLKQLQDQGRLPAGASQDVYANLEGLSQALANINQQPIFTAETDLTFSGFPDYVATAKMQSRGWVVLFAEPQVSFLATVRNNSINTALLISLITLLSTIGTFVLARAMAAPITHLTETASAVAAGNLNISAKVETDDEIGAMAKAFNTMTVELRDMVATLEQRVTDRTQDLEKQTARMRIATEVARDVASAGNLNELLEKSSRLIYNRFNFYHTGIFLLDEKREYAILRASPTEAGRQMLDNHHRLKVGEQGLVGHVAATGEPRIALDVGADPVHFDNPLLPNTRSEMALPFRSNTGVIGVLNIQSDQPEAFSQEDIAILQIMADQLATAVERTRLVEQVEGNLNELEKAYSDFTQKSWNSFMTGDRYVAGYRYNNIRMEPIREAPKETFEKGASGTSTNQSNNSASIPIRLRGQTIGVVNIRFQGNYAPQETITLVEKAADRLASALENARLVEETRQRSQRDSLVTEMTGRLRSTLDLETVLRTAAEELQQAFQLKEAEVYLGIPQMSEGDDAQDKARKNNKKPE